MRPTTSTRTVTGWLSTIAVAALSALSACGGGGDDTAAAVEPAGDDEARSSVESALTEAPATSPADPADPDAPAVVLPDPCTLMTAAEAQELLGVYVVVFGPYDEGTDAMECQFQGVGAPADYGAIHVRTRLDCDRCHPGVDNARPVAELGEHAYIDDTRFLITWTRDGVIYEVYMNGAGGPPTDNEFLTAARQVNS